ncbi:hypothetical protein AB6A40_004804 [Gnathostoma spinigerum]|uniref:26S proteasome regulatory subunit Rpn7 N-terminal domain-containing protein n=1 Tax=Gnathostoma spinigerum TaxID=75299 RepID=A0ABD6EDL8_9BILA
MSISVPDPDELMESHVVDEPNDDFDLNNANDMDEDFGPSNAVLLPNASVEEDAHDSNSEQQTTHLVNTVPIDLDSLSQNYTGYALMNRLIFIADTCPPLQKDAILMLINYVVQNTMNVSMYVNAFSRLDSLRNSGQISSSRAGCAETNSGSANPPASVPNIGMHSQCDSQWIESTMAKAQAHLDVLLTEFKLQKDDGVKESTRRALDDLFQHRVQMGHLQDALKLFGKGMREYCTSPKHIIQMLLNWVEVAIHAGQWFDLGPLCGQIEHAIGNHQEICF